MRLGQIAAAALIAVLFSLPVMAVPLPDGGVTADAIAGVLRNKGFTADITKDNEGDPMISSAAAGAKFIVFSMAATTRRAATAIQFFAGYNRAGVSIETINNWNRDNRFGRAYLSSKDQTPRVEMDVLSNHGFTTEALADDLDTWQRVMGHFQTHIGW